MATRAWANNRMHVYARCRPIVTTTYSFPANPSTGSALQNQLWLEQDNPFGTPEATYPKFDTATAFNHLGELSAGGKVQRFRVCLDMPALYSSISAMRLKFTPSFYSNSNSFTFAWYASNTNDYSSGQSRAANNDNLLASMTVDPTSAPTGVLVTLTAGSLAPYLAAIAAGNLSLILAGAEEIANTNNATAHMEFGNASGDIQIEVDH